MTFRNSRAKTIGDAMLHEVLVGGTGPGSPSEGYPKLLNAGAGTKFRTVAGYPASAEVLLAMEKGEVDAGYTSFGSLSAYHKDWIDSKSVNLLVQGTVSRSRELPDTPAVGELGKTPEDRAMLQLYASTADIGRSIIAPPNVPPDRVAALRAAFDATLRDPEFRDEVARAKAEFNPASGAEVQDIARRNARPPEALIARMKALLRGG
jgi:tripartite-type tricarboxylate transporter receptor subunit TctC